MKCQAANVTFPVSKTLKSFVKEDRKAKLAIIKYHPAVENLLPHPPCPWDTGKPQAKVLQRNHAPPEMSKAASNQPWHQGQEFIPHFAGGKHTTAETG